MALIKFGQKKNVRSKKQREILGNTAALFSLYIIFVWFHFIQRERERVGLTVHECAFNIFVESL